MTWSVQDVAVVIPARNDAADLADAVASVQAQNGVRVSEIVIAVGPSTDDTAVVADQLAAGSSNVTVIDNPSGRTPSGLNLGIDATSAEIVARVDARAVLPPLYLANALETLTSSRAANVGAIQHPIGRTSTQRAVAAAMTSRLGSGGAAYRHAAAAGPVDTAWLGVFQRSALNEVGGYDEDFIRNQDAELNTRLRSAGYEVWLDPRLIVNYLPRTTLIGLARQYWQYGWWRLRTARRHRELRTRQAAVPVVMTIVVGSAVAATAAPVFAVVPGGYLAGCVIAATRAPGLEPDERAKMAAALVVMHGSWAGGFIACAAGTAGRRLLARRFSADSKAMT